MTQGLPGIRQHPAGFYCEVSYSPHVLEQLIPREASSLVLRPRLARTLRI